MIIRNIKVTVTPAGGFFRPSRKCEIDIWLDERPLGRRMRSHYQQARNISAHACIDDLASIASVLSRATHDAIVNDDASLLVETTPSRIRKLKYSAAQLDRLKSQLSATVDTLVSPRKYAA